MLAIPSEADTAEVAAELAPKQDAIEKTIVELKDKLKEVGTNASKVAKQEVGALETTEIELPSGAGVDSHIAETSMRNP